MIDALHRLVPASKSIVTGISTLTADNVLKSLDYQGVSYQINHLRCVDWDLESSELTDDNILPLLRMDTTAHEGEILMCTEACTRYDLKPFRCDATDLAQFVSWYDLEMFFDGDVIFLCENSRTISVYHHEGAYVHVKL